MGTRKRREKKKTSPTRLIERAQYKHKNTAHANPQKMFLWYFFFFFWSLRLSCSDSPEHLICNPQRLQPAYSDREMRREKKEGKLK